MATDARAHAVPAAGETTVRRQTFNDLSLSIRDPIPVANTTARAQRLVELAQSQPPVVPSASSPIFFTRADAGDGRVLEYTTDGVVFFTVPAYRSGVEWKGVATRGSDDAAGNQQWSSFIGVQIPADAPRGRYAYAVLGSLSGSGIVYARVDDGGNGVRHEQVPLGSPARTPITMVGTVEHTGSMVDIRGAMYGTAGAVTAHVGCRATAWFVGLGTA